MEAEETTANNLLGKPAQSKLVESAKGARAAAGIIYEASTEEVEKRRLCDVGTPAGASIFVVILVIKRFDFLTNMW